MLHIRSFGVQHDILFDQLTVHEHLYFYARLKGVPEARIEEAIQVTPAARCLAVICVDCALCRSLSDVGSIVCFVRVAGCADESARAEPRREAQRSGPLRHCILPLARRRLTCVLAR